MSPQDDWPQDGSGRSPSCRTGSCEPSKRGVAAALGSTGFDRLPVTTVRAAETVYPQPQFLPLSTSSKVVLEHTAYSFVRPQHDHVRGQPAYIKLPYYYSWQDSYSQTGISVKGASSKSFGEKKCAGSISFGASLYPPYRSAPGHLRALGRDADCSAVCHAAVTRGPLLCDSSVVGG